MRIQSKNNLNKKVVFIALIAIVLAGAGAYGIYAYMHRNDIKRDANGVSTERTQEDLQLEEELKNDASRKEQSTQTDRPTAPEVDKETDLQKVNVVLTNAGQNGDEVSASGFVSNVVEEGGVCKYIFVSGGKTIEKTSSTLVNANSTTCKTVRFNKSELGVGTWTIHIEYGSNMSAGKSNELEVKVS